jgi:hypothetical protein
MAEIIKKIENLKPGKNYIFSVRTKNTDINAYSESVDSILVSIPKDTTIPDAISNLALYASFENVMFVFDFSNDLDIDKYEYELYDNGAGTGTATSTGFSSANVFTVAVPNSTDTVAKTYWGRVRSVDTTGNLGPWTALTQTDQSTPLIDSQYISSLTASKITAGTIGAQTITLSGANSILKSNNYAAANTTFGGTGWKISGDGKAVFNDASIRSSLDIGEDQGTSDATSFHVDSNGNMWSGSNSTSFSIAPFRVTNTGDVTANSLTLTGRTSLNNSGNASIFLTNNVDGIGLYSDANTAFYVDATDKFSLGNKLTWANSILTVQGVLKLSDGSDVVDAEEVGNIAQDLVDEFGVTIYEDGFIGGLTISANTMYYGNGTFASGNTAFFVGKNSGGQANFSLGDKLTWDGSTLSITGNVTITGGSTLSLIQSAQDAATAAQSDADTAYALAETKITAGEIQVSIDNGTTIISGDRITTGTINADLITAGTLSADRLFGGTISGSAILLGDLYVDTGGFIQATNIEIDAGFRYRCSGVFNSTGSSTNARVHGAGSVEALCSPSSKREYKYNIENIPDALDILKTVRPRVFNWNIDAFDKVDPWTGEPWTEEAKAINEFNKSYGFIAEEMAEDQPLLTVYESPDASLPHDQPGGAFDFSAWKPKMWKEMDFIPLLVKAVQELSAKVEELESRLNS